MTSSVWSAPVRFAEADQQGIVFNAHYLTYCDEAMGAFVTARDLLAFAEDIRLVTSTLTWTASARWGELVEVDVRCERVGRTSLVIAFDVRAGGHPCCQVTTTYVHTNRTGSPQPIPEEICAALVR
ncbi:MAG: thioesterase family protein [Jatrophihabitantaceae bacterium]